MYTLEAIEMMGKKDSQMQLIMLDIGTLVPENHLLRKINTHINFDFIYEKAAPYYSPVGRPSIDPVCTVKMLLTGYLYGIKSERRLVEDISLNIAYRWFCGFELSDKIPDHSLFSQNRRRRFTDSDIFSEIFNHIVGECVRKGLVSGDNVVSDGSFIPANAAESSLVELNREVAQSTVRYMDALDEELRSQPGYHEPVPTVKEKTAITSSTDPECGYISHEHKKGLGYVTEMTVDTDNGIVLGVDCCPANRRESDIILEHIRNIQTNTDVSIHKLALDAGYDVGAVHRGLELLGITGYVSCIQFSYDVLKRDLTYLPKTDCFTCLAGKRLEYIKLVYKRSSQNYYRLYRMSAADHKFCRSCEKRKNCAFSYGETRVNVSSFYPAFYRNRQRYESPEYNAMKRLRSIWAEGTFAALKREHNLKKAVKRGLTRVREECLLSALALNLKRMVKAMDLRGFSQEMLVNFFHCWIVGLPSLCLEVE
jgi:transposase